MTDAELPPTVLPDMLTVEDIARLRKTGRNAVYSAYSRGKLPRAARIGRRLMWRRSDIEDWITRSIEH